LKKSTNVCLVVVFSGLTECYSGRVREAIGWAGRALKTIGANVRTLWVKPSSKNKAKKKMIILKSLLVMYLRLIEIPWIAFIVMLIK